MTHTLTDALKAIREIVELALEISHRPEGDYTDAEVFARNAFINAGDIQLTAMGKAIEGAETKAREQAAQIVSKIQCEVIDPLAYQQEAALVNIIAPFITAALLRAGEQKPKDGNIPVNQMRLCCEQLDEIRSLIYKHGLHVSKMCLQGQDDLVRQDEIKILQYLTSVEAFLKTEIHHASMNLQRAGLLVPNELPTSTIEWAHKIHGAKGGYNLAVFTECERLVSDILLSWEVAIEPTNNWQPIETAPKDGTEIWAYTSEGEQRVVYYDNGEEDGSDSMGHDSGWMSHDGDTFPSRSFGNPEYYSNALDEPRYWQPIPAPPSQPEAK